MRNLRVGSIVHEIPIFWVALVYVCIVGFNNARSSHFHTHPISTPNNLHVQCVEFGNSYWCWSSVRSSSSLKRIIIITENLRQTMHWSTHKLRWTTSWRIHVVDNGCAIGEISLAWMGLVGCCGYISNINKILWLFLFSFVFIGIWISLGNVISRS